MVGIAETLIHLFGGILLAMLTVAILSKIYGISFYEEEDD